MCLLLFESDTDLTALPREPQLVFPPLSSYHRLIIHRLAQRCFLDHQTAEYNPYAVRSTLVWPLLFRLAHALF